jgi:tetratricopeptide (TPR) repeat protein
MEQNQLNDAANKYDMAAFLDKTNKPSRLKMADIYAHINPNQAVATLEELLSVHPDCAPAYKQISELYYSKGLVGKACENYTRYMSYGDFSQKDRERYAQLLFFNKDYPASLAEIKKALAENPDNGVMKRLRGYNLFETGEFAQAASVMEPFMNDANSNLISLDHKYFARILHKNKQDSLALIHYGIVVEMDSSSIPDIYKEMAQAYESLKKYESAGLYYERYINGGTASGTVVFFCGRCFYNAGNTTEADSTERTRLLQKADSFFETVNERTPTSYLGNFWRARTHAQLDPETEQGLAKPFYEQALTILETNPEKYKSELLECYKYLGYYFYLQKENAASIAYWEKVLALDPSNAMATEAIKGIKGSK